MADSKSEYVCNWSSTFKNTKVSGRKQRPKGNLKNDKIESNGEVKEKNKPTHFFNKWPKPKDKISVRYLVDGKSYKLLKWVAF